MAKTLTIRMRGLLDDIALERLQEVTGQATASKALIKAGTAYPGLIKQNAELKHDLQRLTDLIRKRRSCNRTVEQVKQELLNIDKELFELL